MWQNFVDGSEPRVQINPNIRAVQLFVTNRIDDLLKKEKRISLRFSLETSFIGTPKQQGLSGTMKLDH